MTDADDEGPPKSEPRWTGCLSGCVDGCMLVVLLGVAFAALFVFVRIVKWMWEF